MPVAARVRKAVSRMSPTVCRYPASPSGRPGGAAAPAPTAGLRSMLWTSCPSSASLRTRSPPSMPAPPVTNTRMSRLPWEFRGRCTGETGPSGRTSPAFFADDIRPQARSRASSFRWTGKVLFSTPRSQLWTPGLPSMRRRWSLLDQAFVPLPIPPIASPPFRRDVSVVPVQPPGATAGPRCAMSCVRGLLTPYFPAGYLTVVGFPEPCGRPVPLVLDGPPPQEDPSHESATDPGAR